MDEGYFQHIREHPEISDEDVRIIRAQRPAARQILDLGCGRGGFVEHCRRELGAALGLDNEPTAARICRAEGLPFVLADVTQLPFVDDTFDVVRAKEIIEHLPEPRFMLREVHRVLRPSGLFLAHVPSHFSVFYPVNNFWDDYTHVRPLSRSGLQRLLADAGFAIEFTRGYTAGRNIPERALGRVLALIMPHTWLAVSTKQAA